jgi:tetratricopeptide (TPR) repeat protein
VAIDRDKILSAAQKYVEKKRFDRAGAEYQKILQEDPNDVRTLLKLGDLQSKMEAYADAVVSYERVGKFYASQGFSLKAIAVYKQIREIIAKHVPELEPRYAHITPTLADLYQQLGLTSDALAALDDVATRLQRQNRDDEAIDVFRKIVELDPTNPLSHLRLAEALSRVRQTEESVLEFGTASGQLLRLGRRDDAIKVIERLLQLRPDPTHARISAELHLARNGPADAMQALAKLQICFQANRHDLDTLGLLARAFTQIGQAAKAIEVHKEMARIARDSNRSALFREIVTKLQKLAPNDDGVQELATIGAASAAAEESQTERRGESHRNAPEVAEGEDAYEDVGDSDFEETDAQPIELARRSIPARPEDDVVVESTIDVVEEVSDLTAPAGAREHVARILADAAAFRRERELERSIATLRTGIQLAPKALEIREMLRELLLDTGNTEQAVTEMIAIAELLVEALDGEEAARTLQDALAIDPECAVAAQMLHDLGYELVEEGAEAPHNETVPAFKAHPSSLSDPEAPLPSYDLEEIGPEDVALRSYADVGVEVAKRAAEAGIPAATTIIDSIDDPFMDSPLPSFPLDEDATRRQAAMARPAGPPRGIPELESALEEADFFASRGLFEDARTILQEQLARLPNHPLLHDRLEELEMQEGSAYSDSGTRPSPAAASAQERKIDIAISLSALDGLDEPTEGSSPAFAVPTQQVDVEEVFAKFKAGVALQIGIEDTQSHYDLGVAYKEMGLVEDALREFELAARDTKRACVCHSMIGMLELERGRLNEAIEAFSRGLQSPERTKDQEAALCYEIGAAYEAKKMVKHALDHFQRTARLIPAFRDVQERIRRLQKAEPRQQSSRAAAVGADDEFERVFDDMLGGANGNRQNP